MNNIYIKTSARGSDSEIASIISILPHYTDHLNQVNTSLTLTRRLKEIGIREKNDRIVNAMLDIEKQGAFNQFIALCLLDLLVIYKNALSAIHLWDELYSLRQSYLLIYEALKTYNSHGKSLKELASKTSSSTESKFFSLSDKLKEFKQDFKYDSVISDFRNNVIGHIEADPVSFFNKMSRFDTNKAFAALKAFLSILLNMLQLSDLIFLNYTINIIKQVSHNEFFYSGISVEVDKLLEILENTKNKSTTAKYGLSNPEID